MSDALLFVLVVAVVLFALGVDLAALVGFSSRSTWLVRHPLPLVLIKLLLRRVLHDVLRHEKNRPRAVVLLLDLHGLERNGDILP